MFMYKTTKAAYVVGVIKQKEKLKMIVLIKF